MRVLLVLLGLASCTPTEHVHGVPLKSVNELGRVAAAGNVDVNIDAVESAIIQEALGRVTLLARREQGALQSEKSLQYSGDFSDEAVAGLGRQLGAMYLFVGQGNVVELPKERNDPKPIACAAKFAPGEKDDDKTVRGKNRQRENCEEQNAEAQRHYDRQFAQQAAKKRYKLRLRVVDVTQGAVVATADFVADEGDFGSSCDLDCMKDKAARRAVRFLLADSLQKQPEQKTAAK